MDNNLIARTSIKINMPNSKCWDALVNPEAIKQYMFGTNVVTDWREGGPIIRKKGHRSGTWLLSGGGLGYSRSGEAMPSKELAYKKSHLKNACAIFETVCWVFFYHLFRNYFNSLRE
jgi:hypothetical protein